MLSTLLLRSKLNVLVGLVKGGLMVSILAGKLLAELESDTVNADLRVENLRLLDSKNIVKFLKTLIGGQSFGLNLILVGLLVK